MRVASLTTLAVAALATLAAPAGARAAEGEAPADSAGDAGTDSAEPARPNRPAKVRPPATAAAALLQAAAAYEYGDMNQVVEAARPVAEGLLPSSPDEHARSLRLLGMGLYLTNRPRGAETAFTELLREEPHARLDPTNTRPELVAFFENLRRQQYARQRRLIWNFIPPVGQFQNEDNAKGWVILAVGVASFGTALTTDYLLHSWEQPGHTFPGHPAKAVRAVNWISTGVLAATYLYGVIDGIIGYSRPLDDSKSSVAFKVFPEGGVGFSF